MYNHEEEYITMSKKILVVSSANMDFVMRVGEIPVAGMTMIESRSYNYVPGGKGANSALAFARLGAESVFCTRLGADANGDSLRALYDGAGIDTRYIVTDKTVPTGLAVIMVEDAGANRIIVYPGANSTVCRADVEAALDCAPDAVFMQLEIGEQAILDTAALAAERGIPVFVDAGPARADFPLGKMPGLTVLSPNETETAIFTGISPDTEADCIAAARKLAEMADAKYIIIKLGGRGAFVWDTAAEIGETIPSYPTEVVDTTAAGDAFTAALTLEYLRSGDILRAARYGNVVGSITVSRAGASTSIPTADEVEACIAARGIML